MVYIFSHSWNIMYNFSFRCEAMSGVEVFPVFTLFLRLPSLGWINQKEIVASNTGLAVAGKAWLRSLVLSSEKGLWVKRKLVGEELRTHVTRLSLCPCSELKLRVCLTSSLVSWMVGCKASVFGSDLVVRWQ